MTRFRTLGAFFLGWASAALCALIVADLKLHAAGDDMVHVCVAANGVMRLVAPVANCAPGQQSLSLKKWAPPDSADAPDDKPKTPAASSADRTLTDDLQRRVSALEGVSTRGALTNHVVAPFEVVDRGGKRIFYVEEGAARVYNAAGAEVASINAGDHGENFDGGGTFVGKSASGGLTLSVGAGTLGSDAAAALFVNESAGARMYIGKVPGSDTYRALFYRTEGGRVVAGLGQAANGKGIAYVADTEGVHRADLAVGADGKAKISISDSTAKDVAVLTEGEKSAGLFTLYGSGGQPMVVAGVDAGGFGVVRAGPESFTPGLGLLGLPGSYIAGKP